MANLATQTINRAGLEPAYSNAAGGGDTFAPADDVLLHVKNGGGAPITVTIDTPHQAFDGAEIEDIEVAIPAGEERLIGPFPANHFADPADGRAHVAYSGVTSVTVGVLKLA
jgi:hypothetical protein